MIIKDYQGNLINLDNYDVVQVIGEQRMDGFVYAVRARKVGSNQLIAEFDTMHKAQSIVNFIYEKAYSKAGAVDIQLLLEV